ncbi:hypothetical protein [Pradoshia eiseniae]|nr:hypothetical protein [Pradoshia eiseniae]
MEKAMRQAHGIGYEQYNQKLDVRMRVEKRRENSYLKSNEIVNDLNRRVF